MLKLLLRNFSIPAACFLAAADFAFCRVLLAHRLVFPQLHGVWQLLRLTWHEDAPRCFVAAFEPPPPAPSAAGSESRNSFVNFMHNCCVVCCFRRNFIRSSVACGKCISGCISVVPYADQRLFVRLCRRTELSARVDDSHCHSRYCTRHALSSR